MVKQVQEFQLSSLNITTEMVSTLGALPLKENYSATKEMAISAIWI